MKIGNNLKHKTTVDYYDTNFRVYNIIDDKYIVSSRSRIELTIIYNMSLSLTKKYVFRKTK